jgi:hypothetical protein
MDFDLLKKDGTALVKELPKAFVEDLARLLMMHDMRELFPKLATLMPHIRALMMESMTGGIDEKELEETIRAIVESVGVKIPTEPNPEMLKGA